MSLLPWRLALVSPPTPVLLFWAGIGSGAVHRTGIGTLPPWQVKMREEAVAKAAQEWEGERERMAKEARALRQKLDASASQNKQLVTDKNILQVRPCMHACWWWWRWWRR